MSIEVNLLQQTLASEARIIKRTTASSKSSVLRAAFGRMQNSTRGLRLHVVAADKFLRRGSTKPFDNLKADRDAGFCNVNQHPKLSPDFNAIEGWWRVLQQRLSLTAPAELESRGDFLKRLRRNVAWLNKNARPHAKQLCASQKVREKAVKKLKGARCKWESDCICSALHEFFV